MNLLSIGTALGGFMGGYEGARDREQKRRQQDLNSLMAMQEYQTKQKDRQREDQAARGYFDAARDTPDLSGLGGAPGMPSLGGGAPSGGGVVSQQPMPSAPRPQPASFTPPQPSPGGGQSLPTTDSFPANPTTTAADYGPGSPLGGYNPGTERTGKVAPDPAFQKDMLSRDTPFPKVNDHGAISAPVQLADASGAPQQTQAAPQIPPQIQQQVQIGAQRTAGSIDPMLQGKMSLRALAQQVEKSMPDADPVSKAMALDRLSKALAPSERAMWQSLANENRQQFQLALKDMQIEAANQRQDKSLDAARDKAGDVGWDFITKPDGSIVRANKRTGQVEPTTLDPGSSKMSGTPRSLPAMVAQKWKQEHPNATSEDFQRFAGQYKRNQSIEGAFGGGPQSRNLLALNTVADHLTLLQEYAQALQNNDIPKANLVLNKFATETGKPEVVNFETARDIAADEVVRLLTQTGGAESDRKGMQAHFAAANSPEQLLGAISVAGRFVAGRFHGLEQGYAGNDPSRRKQFEEEMITPEARKWFSPGGQAGGAAPTQGGAPGGAEEVVQNGWRYKKQGEQYVPVGPAQ
jgi:hypothetical protein